MKGNNTMTISEINNKRLDSLYVCLYCHKNTIQINSNITLSKINIYNILGVNKKMIKQLYICLMKNKILLKCGLMCSNI